MIVLVKLLHIGMDLMNELRLVVNVRLVKINLNVMQITVLLVLKLIVIVTVSTAIMSTLGF